MSRAKWKGFFSEISVLNSKHSNIKTWSRRSVISHDLVGKNLSVYNGKLFKLIKITEEKVGYKLGEFSFTRIMKERLKKKKNIRNLKKK